MLQCQRVSGTFFALITEGFLSCWSDILLIEFIIITTSCNSPVTELCIAVFPSQEPLGVSRYP